MINREIFYMKHLCGPKIFSFLLSYNVCFMHCSQHISLLNLNRNNNPVYEQEGYEWL